MYARTADEKWGAWPIGQPSNPPSIILNNTRWGVVSIRGGWNFVSTYSSSGTLEGAEYDYDSPEVRKPSAKKFPK